DLGALRAEQDLDGGVESQGEGGQFGRGEGALPAFGLVDGLPAPRPAQVATQGLAQVGQRQLPLGPEACDLPPDDLFDPHPRFPSVITFNDIESSSLTTGHTCPTVTLQLSLSMQLMTDGWRERNAGIPPGNHRAKRRLRRPPSYRRDRRLHCADPARAYTGPGRQGRRAHHRRPEPR